MATIKDLAKEADLAVGTVSRVLNNRGYISEQTRDKVYSAMKRIGYSPNTFAQGLSKRKMDCIAVIVPHIAHPYFAKIISRLEKEASRRGYKVIIFNSSGDAAKESDELLRYQSSFISGALLFSADISAEALMSLQIPLVLVEREPVGNAVSIQCDNVMGGGIAANRLIEKGCRNLITISSLNTADMPGDDRANEFVRVCRESGATVKRYSADPSLYLASDYHAVITQALDENPECDGIFATSDLIAAQVIQECNKKGLRIPGDIKLVGFDDVELARLTSPTITTVHQPIHEIAEAAIETIERLNEGKKVSKKIILPVKLIERESA
ncbi:MAG: LacI family DNA-binding transcriptional regulator [Lachnospiraceae bacterium]|nr:LacI family DNA-binding transcriptional regulator [Lachnospiraceae bacterium]